MDVALPANRRRVPEEFRSCADGRLDVRLCLFVRLELFLFTECYCGQDRATPSPEIFRSKIFTCDLAKILVYILRSDVSYFPIFIDLLE